ncbi:MAG: V-type ATP synthase subunit C [Methanosarcinaceae archaeon]|nr:V-type ATP synthase subunit C [Methanosarcinaceae archaeon]
MGFLQKYWPGGESSQYRGSSNYAYFATRVRAMKSKLLPKEIYPRLMNMGISEITRFIGESGYKQEIDELARTYSGVDLIEHGLNKNLAETFTKLINISEGEPNYLLTEYLKNYDVWNLKTILRGKYYDASTDEIKESLVSAGQFSYTFLSELAGKSSYGEVIAALEGTEYHSILKDYDEINLSVIENRLDKMYYDGLFNIIGESKSKDRKLFATFIKTEIDIKNLKTLFRLKKAEVDSDEILDLIIDGGLELSIKNIKKLLPLSYHDFIQALNKYSYWNSISDAVTSDTGSLINVETQLTKHSLKSASSFSHVYPLSIVPIMDYIISKRNEVNNLRIITRGKAANLSDDVIRNQLVI